MENEPQLKYYRLDADVTKILNREAATCLCVAEKMLALGTDRGSVYLLSCLGDEVQAFHYHNASVQDVCFDEPVETLGSCSSDGSILVRSLISDEKFTVRLNRALNTMTFDPKFNFKTNAQIASGGVSGKLTLSSQGWLGSKNTILHSSHGPIHQVKWFSNFIAWTNDQCIRVYNMTSHDYFILMERPQQSCSMESSNCHLYWHPDGTLYISWISSIIIASFPTQDPGSSFGLDSINIINRFETNDVISGVAPFGYQLAVLTYIKNKDSTDGSLISRPTIQMFANDHIEISSDNLPITSLNQMSTNEFQMIPCYPTSCIKTTNYWSKLGAPSGRLPGHTSSSGVMNTGHSFIQWWCDGEEPLYYVLTPKEVFVGVPRGRLDRVEWLLDHYHFNKALSIASVFRNSDTKSWNKTVDRYLEHLINKMQFNEAAELCPQLLGTDSDRWEKYVSIFAHENQLSTLSFYIPTQNPTLKSCSYNLVLRSLINQPVCHTQLEQLINRWPPSLYSPGELAKEIEIALCNIECNTIILKEVLAEFYILQGFYGRVLELYIELKRSGVFKFILQHALFRFLRRRVVLLISIDELQALELFCNHINEVSSEDVINEVTTQMKTTIDGNTNTKLHDTLRLWLYKYMDRVITENIFIAPNYHCLLVELYAEYEPIKLMKFLKSSHQFPLDQAYEICKTRGLIKEMVYILSRMGNPHGALQLIIEELADVPQAIEFVRSQNEDTLWDSLIDWAVSKASTTGDLLDHAGGHIDPLRLISKIPKNMEIWNLRNRLCRIIADYRTQTRLQEGCDNILKSDCVHMESQLYSEVRHCIRQIYVTSNLAVHSEEDCALWRLYDTVHGSSMPISQPRIEAKNSVVNVMPHGQDLWDSAKQMMMPSEISDQDIRTSMKIGFAVENNSQNEDHSVSVSLQQKKKQCNLDINRKDFPGLI
eukprot:g7190.t1